MVRTQFHCGLPTLGRRAGHVHRPGLWGVTFLTTMVGGRWVCAGCGLAVTLGEAEAAETLADPKAARTSSAALVASVNFELSINDLLFYGSEEKSRYSVAMSIICFAP